MVEEILNDKNNDRRRLFEEAAGVTKYKDHVEHIIETIENKYKSPIIDVKHDGTKDTGRPLKRDGQGPYISNGGVFNLNIGPFNPLSLAISLIILFISGN